MTVKERECQEISHTDNFSYSEHVLKKNALTDLEYLPSLGGDLPDALPQAYLAPADMFLVYRAHNSKEEYQKETGRKEERKGKQTRITTPRPFLSVGAGNRNFAKRWPSIDSHGSRIRMLKGFRNALKCSTR